MCIYVLSWNVQTFIYMHYDLALDSTFLFLFFAIMATIYFATNPRPELSRFGITKKFFLSSIMQSIVWTIAFCALATGAAYLLASQPFHFSLHIDPKRYTSMLIYLPFSFVQEFIIRGVLQTTLYNIYKKQYLFLAILVSNLIFACAHVTFFGLTHALLTIIPGIMWGYMYYKKPNLAGVTLSHTLIGIYVFDILNFQFIPTEYCIYSLI